MSSETIALKTWIAEISAQALARLALRVDAVVTGANGVAYLALASVLDSPLGIGAGTLRAVGAFLIVFAGGVWIAGGATTVRAATLRVVAAMNFAWIAASATAVAADWFTATAGGGAWIVAQALVVGAFAVLQLVASRRL